MSDGVHFFGIRHHGPGCARSLLRALEALQPDIVLVEGPADAEAAELLLLASDAAMQPPVALLLYQPDNPRLASWYPFADFSPEWQAIRHALGRGVPLRFIDLPMAQQLAARQALAQAAVETPLAAEGEAEEESGQDEAEADDVPPPDSIAQLARAAGYEDSERWWEHLVEHRDSDAEVFAAIEEAMTALRPEAIALPGEIPEDPLARHRGAWREHLREAHMRQCLRAAQKEGFQRIAVVCGAWHVPALRLLPPAKQDQALLKGLPKIKVAACWTPWTYERLSFASGYGAGIGAPGWYAHLWRHPGADARAISTTWLVGTAQLLRARDLDISPGHVIEAVRLAETLATLRGRALPDLADLREATVAVFGEGGSTKLDLVQQEQLVGKVLGAVPESAPAVPLLRDLQRQQKSLRLPNDTLDKPLELDLRKDNDLARSHLLHRLDLLGLPWGDVQGSSGRGTFKETWRLAWRPEFVVTIIEAAVWGNTVLGAAEAWARDRAGQRGERALRLPQLTELLQQALLADLAQAVPDIMQSLHNGAAQTQDVSLLLQSLPPLAGILRYGNVRRSDTEMVGQAAAGIAVRASIGLSLACSSLDDEAAVAMLRDIRSGHDAVGLLQDPEVEQGWRAALRRLADARGVHGLVAGACCRLLYDAGQLTAEEGAQRLSLALSTASDPAQAAAWLEGYLGDSGLLLLHDERLWQVLADWVAGIGADPFVQVLPLLRRAFSLFAAPERRQLGMRAASGAGPAAAVAAASHDLTRAARALPTLAQLFGLPLEASP